MTSRRATRLSRELEELLKCPIPNVSAGPRDDGDDISEWHGCIRPSTDSQHWDNNLVIHFKIIFPPGYPQAPPKVILSSFFPHVNIITDSGGWALCLDFLQPPAPRTPTVPYQYWSSGFSVRSILIQMTSFIFCDDQPLETVNGGIVRCRQECASFVCSCGHSIHSPIPRFPTFEEIQRAPTHFPPLTITTDASVKLRERIFCRTARPLSIMPGAVSQVVDVWENVGVDTGKSKPDEDKPSTKRSLRPSAKIAPPMIKSSDKNSSGGNVILNTFPPKSISSNALDSSSAQSDWKKGWGGPSEVKSLGIFGRLSRDTVASVIGDYLETNDILALGTTCRAASLISDDWWMWKRLFLKNYPQSALQPAGQWTPLKGNSNVTQAWKYAYILEANRLSEEMRCFHSLSTKNDDILGIPLEYTINPKSNEVDCITSSFDIISYGAYSAEGVRRTMWGERFSAFLPLYIDSDHFERAKEIILATAFKLIGNRKKQTESADRKHKMDNIAEERDRSGIDDNWRVGSKVPPAPASYQSNQASQKFSGNWRDRSTPMEESSNKSQKTAPKKEATADPTDLVTDISTREKLWKPLTREEMLVTLIVKLMNTQVLLLCDKGIAVSERALTGYCQIHRLLLAFVKEYPDLRALVSARLETFIKKPESRVKASTPSLGDLFCMVTCSDSVSWSKIFFHALLESFDRGVLWSCVHGDSSLATVVPGDMSRLQKVFDAQRVSLRIKAFHAIFIDLLLHGGGTPDSLDKCMDRYDLFQGRPPLCLQNEWRRRVKQVMEMQSWNDYFNVSCIPVPKPEVLLNLLETAVSNSLAKGYHSEHTKFENIHRSGVSRILLKGESYTAAPNVRKVRLFERWKFDGASIYLDASCLLFNFDGKHMYTVDYSSRRWNSENKVKQMLNRASDQREACVSHSGDVIHDNNGEHTIDINLGSMSSSISSLFFTVSAWTTTLRQIIQPNCIMHDVDSDVPLCSYMYEGADTLDYTAVIMCKLYRSSPEGRWKLTTIGHLGYGRAGTYGPIIEDITTKFLDLDCGGEEIGDDSLHPPVAKLNADVEVAIPESAFEGSETDVDSVSS